MRTLLRVVRRPADPTRRANRTPRGHRPGLQRVQLAHPTHQRTPRHRQRPPHHRPERGASSPPGRRRRHPVSHQRQAHRTLSIVGPVISTSTGGPTHGPSSPPPKRNSELRSRCPRAARRAFRRGTGERRRRRRWGRTARRGPAESSPRPRRCPVRGDRVGVRPWPRQRRRRR